jgi:uncharacterized phage-associated protein
MSYSANLIAYAFVNKAIQDGNPITQMKLQKMLYFAQGVHLVLNDKSPLFKEHFQAWKYGPVIPDIYQAYKFYGSQPITDTFFVTLWNSEDFEAGINDLDEKARHTINLTWENTKEIDAIKLSNWTHSPDSPWSKYYKNNVPDLIIPNEDIYNYFTKFFIKDR